MRRNDHGTPDHRVRLCFISYSHLTRLALAVLEEFEERADIEVIDATFYSALECARQREEAGMTDAFISAGANAMILRGALSTPVATIKAGGYDVLLALMKAREDSHRVGVVTYFNTIPELDAIRDLLKSDIAQDSYRTPEEARECVRKLAANGHNVIVGSSVVVELAEEQGLRGILAYSLLSIRQGIEDAIDLARVARLEAARYEQINGVLHNLQEAVLAVDAANCIIAVNSPMEMLLSRPRKALLGMALGRLEPALSLQATLDSGREERGQVAQFAQREWIVNRTPIQERGRTVGAVITLYDANAIREADTSLRSQRRNHQHPAARYHFASLDGQSPLFLRARESAQRFARTDLTVLITGESGTGKELFAQAIHNASARADKPFVAANCAAFPESLLESELFGYEEGAFTGSRKGGKRGLFETAHTGTLFLDEIGDMPLSLQTRLLRVLQEREVVRLGGVIPIPIDVRILAATHQPLDVMMREGRFRSDLFYRINILQLSLPPLRERAIDIPVMAQAMLARCLKRLSCRLDARSLLAPLADTLCAYGWPGNVRELENLCERMAVFFAQYGSVAAVDYEALAFDCPELFRLPRLCANPEETGTHATGPSILRMLEECGGNRTRAAKRLGMSRATLWRRLHEMAEDSTAPVA
ncbi:MAG: propionate catabolism operon regulatory protein PrpR [Janthinobacterium lividum]